jgi:ribonuclease HII
VNPTLKFERELFSQGYRFVVGIDEVGRGAFGGPVAVGLCVVSADSGNPPSGVKDSKLLTPIVREKLVPEIQGWAESSAVGMSSAAEIDDLGMTAALRLAGMRALAELELGDNSILILDGSHDWLTPAQANLFDAEVDFDFQVITKVKADMSCLSVAAASVLAKVQRDTYVRRLDAVHAGYGWASHMGYGTAAHREAITKLGLSPEHRKSWNIHSD